jgi:hypothetical protein
METCGGARVDWVAKRSLTGVAGRDSLAWTSMLGTRADFSDGCGCADCDVLTARQQSWPQQPVVPTER